MASSMGALLDQAAERFGDRKAMVFFELGEELTYAELKDQADRCACALSRLGIGKGSHVAIMLPNVPQFPITWFALAKLGAVMVPVNCRYTARELAYLLNDGEADSLVIHADYAALLDGLGEWPASLNRSRIIAVGGAAQGIPNQWDDLIGAADPAARPQAEVGLDDLLNIQYTSGTTGMPKGCMQTHRYWVSAGYVMNFIDGPVERILATAFFFYLDTLLMTSLALHAGATVYVARQMSASRFMDWVRKYDIDFVFMFEPIFKQPPTPVDGQNKLRLACILGFSKENHAALEARFNTIARERFGMTEGSPTLYMPNDHAHMVGSGSCGIPAPFRELTIRDDRGRQVTQGEIGELWIRGPSILRGYYKKPEANADAFRDGWFRTGDLFRQDADGYYYIVGRIKDMIRRSEENISAFEVETVLRSLPGIHEAACVPVPDEIRGEEVKAYVQLESGYTREQVAPETIFEHCAKSLAAFKVPRYLEYRDGFDYGPSEKVEKRKLIAATDDLRKNSYDRVDQVWR